MLKKGQLFVCVFFITKRADLDYVQTNIQYTLLLYMFTVQYKPSNKSRIITLWMWKVATSMIQFVYVYGDVLTITIFCIKHTLTLYGFKIMRLSCYQGTRHTRIINLSFWKVKQSIHLQFFQPSYYLFETCLLSFRTLW